MVVQPAEATTETRIDGIAPPASTAMAQPTPVATNPTVTGNPFSVLAPLPLPAIWTPLAKTLSVVPIAEDMKQPLWVNPPEIPLPSQVAPCVMSGLCNRPSSNIVWLNGPGSTTVSPTISPNISPVFQAPGGSAGLPGTPYPGALPLTTPALPPAATAAPMPSSAPPVPPPAAAPAPAPPATAPINELKQTPSAETPAKPAANTPPASPPIDDGVGKARLTRGQVQAFNDRMQAPDELDRMKAMSDISELIRLNPDLMTRPDTREPLLAFVAKSLSDNSEVVRGIGLMILDTGRVRIPPNAPSTVVPELKHRLERLALRPADPEEGRTAKRILTDWDLLTADNTPQSKPQVIPISPTRAGDPVMDAPPAAEPSFPQEAMA